MFAEALSPPAASAAHHIATISCAALIWPPAFVFQAARVV